jgi:hypothetical protein
MDSLTVETAHDKHWYLAVGDRSIGPLTTDLVTRGIESGRVPLTAWICQVGATSWSALSSFGEFQDVVDRVLALEVPANQQGRERSVSTHPSPRATQASTPVSAVHEIEEIRAAREAAQAIGALNRADLVSEEDEQPTAQHSAPSFYPSDPAPLPSFVEMIGDEDFVGSASPAPSIQTTVSSAQPIFYEASGEREAGLPFRDDLLQDPVAEQPNVFSYADAQAFVQRDTVPHEPQFSHDDLGIDVTFDEDHENAIDWKERFQSYFLVGTEVELPDEARLLKSLRETPRATFLHDEALWNLALCLAFGSDTVAATSAQAFFDAVGPEQGPERIEWICRTLLSKGFMPSGIPRSEGMRAIDVLQRACPVGLRDVLGREALD